VTDRWRRLSCHDLQVPRPISNQAPRATLIALLILVFVDAQDAATPLPGALARAAEEALGPDVSVSIRTLAADQPMAALVERGRAEHDAFVARVTWSDERRSNARIEIAASDSDLSRNSVIAFDGSDPRAEQGRALGLVLAALIAPEKQARLARAPPPPPPPATVVTSNAPAPAPAARRFAIDAAAEGGFAFRGAGSGVGGAIGFRWRSGHSVDLRLGVQARYGEVGSAQATELDLSGAAGLALYLVAPSDSGRFALALRADALLVYQTLDHLSSDDPEPVREGRVLPGARLLAEGQWALSPTLALALDVGPEAVFGRTDVYVRQQKVAEIAPLRLIVAAGLIARF